MPSTGHNEGMSKAKRFSDEIRRVIETSGMSRYAICKKLRMDQGAMSNFMHGKRGMELSTLDRLAAFLDLHITRGAGSMRRKGK